jgi:Glycogen recognition site of AMP-activated protein kinase
MERPRINLPPSPRVKLEKQRPENAGAKSTARARQGAPKGSVPVPKAQPLATSRRGINHPEPSPASQPSSATKSTEPAKVSAGSRPVCFELFAPNARTVFLAGSFNQWNPTATPMTRMGADKWVKELYLPAGRYEYQFVLDGRWTPDLKAAEEIPNLFGGFNSVVEVSTSS